MKNRSDELKSFIKLNKVSREKKAKKLGFISADAYRNYLEGKPSNPTGGQSTDALKTGGTKSKKASASKPSSVGVVIHVVDILDRSGSMSGSKVRAAANGINEGLVNMKKGEEGVTYTHTLCEFSDNHRVTIYPLRKVTAVSKLGHETYGSTALFDAIGKTVTAIRDKVKPGEKVLINIYTDGEENNSRYYSANQIKELIDDLSLKGYTFTFIGTEKDVKYVNKTLNIDMSNTLAYDGTGKGLERGMAATNVARTAYVNDVKAGKDVSKGFYKNIQKK